MRAAVPIFTLVLPFLACGGDGGGSASDMNETAGEAMVGGPPAISSEPWGITPEGQQVTLFTLRNASGMTVQVSDWGGIVTRVLVPDRNGNLADVVLGYDALDAYLAGDAYLGAVIGRYANRIGGARFELDGAEYRLAANDGPNQLHGGVRGFDRHLWDTFTTVSGPIPGSPLDVPGAGRASLVLSRVSEDGEQGYPGRLEATVSISLTNGNELRFDYEATTDAPTVVNFTHHGYWNLAGHDTGAALDQRLQLQASRMTPVDEGLIPTGELRHVEGTVFDFRTPVTVGSRIEADDEQLRVAGGYDHNFVLDDWTGDGALKLAGRLTDPVSGRVMEVLTTEPGLQVYAANYLEKSGTGKGGASYGPRSGLALETQHFPDSPNQAAFPSTVLRPGERFRSKTTFRFRTD